MRAKRSRIITRVLLDFVLVLYVLVAMLNYSLVQSYIAAKASTYLSAELGGKIRIGSIHVSPFSHLMLRDVELISPTNDTLLEAESLNCRFHKFPVSGQGLDLDRVSLTNAYYHFESIRRPDSTMTTNLQFIIDYFGGGKPHVKKENPSHFIVKVGLLLIRNVNYRMDLPEPRTYQKHEHGVDIPHMRFNNIHGRIKNICVDNDHVVCRVVSLSTTERSGLHIKDASFDTEVSPYLIQAQNLELETDSSRVLMDATLTYDGWHAMDGETGYLENVMHHVTIKPGTSVNLCDAAYWAPVLWGIDARVQPTGYFWGPISDLHAEEVEVHFGKSSVVQVDAQITGLPYIESTRIVADVPYLHTSYADLMGVKHPEYVKIYVPELLEKMCVMDASVQFDGTQEDCHASVELMSLMGDLRAQADLAYNPAVKDYEYSAHVESEEFGIRDVLPNEWVSKTGFHLSAHGIGVNPQQMSVALEGQLTDTYLRKNRLSRTTISAEYADQVLAANVNIQDTLVHLALTAAADLSQEIPAYTADLMLREAHLTQLKLINADSSCVFNTRIHAALQGADLDHLVGRINLDNTLCQWGSRPIALEKLSLSVDEEDSYKRLSVNSDWFRMALSGYYNYSGLMFVIQDFCHRYLPAYFNPYVENPVVDYASLSETSFNLDMDWVDTAHAFASVIPSLHIASGTTLHGNYNYAESLKLSLRSSSVGYGDLWLRDVGLSTAVLGNVYGVKLQAGDLMVAESPLLENVSLRVAASPHTSSIRLVWDDNAEQVFNEGDIEFFLSSDSLGNKIDFSRTNFYVMGEQWSLSCPHGITFDDHSVLLNNLKVYGDGQSVAAKVVIQQQESDYLKMAFSDFALDRWSNLLLKGSGFAFDGSVDGQFTMQGFSETPYFNANLMIDNCSINGQHLGDLDVRTNYSTQQKRLYVDLTTLAVDEDEPSVQPLEAHGFLELGQSDPEVDLDLQFDSLTLETVAPLLSSFASQFSGSLSGSIDIRGHLSHPTIEGTAIVNQGLLKLDPTGVTYTFADTLTLFNDSLKFHDFTIFDSKGNSALVNGNIALKDRGLMINLGLKTDRLLALDRKADGSNYYGTLYVAASGTVIGPVNDIVIKAVARTLDGSDIHYPITDRRQMSEQDYIHFVSHDPVIVEPLWVRQKSHSSAANSLLDLQLDLSITPGVKLYLPMDFSTLGANVVASGSGDLRLTLSSQDPMPVVLGSYEINSGTFSLSLLNLITQHFVIEEGSSLNFPGNVNDARFDIKAYYGQRVNLSTLTGSTSSTADQYIQVEDVIALSGTLDQPSIHFDIRLPNADQSVIDEVFTYIDRNNERDILNQSVSLLVLGSFANASNISPEASDGMTMVANSVGSMVSSLIKVVDVKFKYKSETELTTQQIDVDIRKEWDKLYFESTFGYGGGMRDYSADAVNNTIIGDVLLGYKFDHKRNAYIFNRTNTNDFSRSVRPYKQGIGFKTSRDFDTWDQLFKNLFRRNH